MLHEFRQSQPWIEWTDGEGQPQRGLEAVGYSHRMVELTFRGLTRRTFSNLDWEVALPESEIDAALLYVRAKLQEHQLYNPAIEVVIRADRAVTDTLLGSAAAGSGVSAGERLYHLASSRSSTCWIPAACSRTTSCGRRASPGRGSFRTRAGPGAPSAGSG